MCGQSGSAEFHGKTSLKLQGPSGDRVEQAGAMAPEAGFERLTGFV